MERRARAARLLVAALAVGIVIAAMVAPWHSAMSCDGRTYAEMIDGVSRHGLPYTENGPLGTSPAQRARFNAVRDGRLWGAYAPAFPYAALPAYRLGGLRGVIRFNVMLLAVLALLTGALARRVLADPLAAAAAAYLSVLGAPSMDMASDVSPYTLTIVLIVGAVLLAVAARDAGGVRGGLLAAGSGCAAALAVEAHLLVTPMLGAIGLGLAACAADDETSRGAFAPSRGSIGRAGAFVAGLVPPFAAAGWLNQLRFETWNPLTMGKCIWRTCAETGLDRQSPGALLAFAWPALLWGAATASAAWLARRSQGGLIAAAAASAIALATITTLRLRAYAIAAFLWGLVVDLSLLDLAPLKSPKDGLGYFFGPYVVRSTLECAPFLALALFARFPTVRQRRAAAMVAVPALALYGALALRGGMPAVYALGFPLLSLRLVTPALPLLVVLAVAALGSRPWSREAWVVFVAVALPIGAWLAATTDDHGFGRRMLLLRLLPASAALACALHAAERTGSGLPSGARKVGSARPARREPSPSALSAALAVGLAVAVTVGVDIRGTMRMRGDHDRWLDGIAAILPARCAIVGWATDIDVPLSMRASRDVEYADLYETDGFDGIRPLVDRWIAQGRPVYVLWRGKGELETPWPDLHLRTVDAKQGVYTLSA
ncbi:MAG: hypothetical protein U0166_12310 [Acidobacteriota bacterium]